MSQLLNRRRHLSLDAMEERCTPATLTYAAATQTLTIVAANNDQVQVGTVMNVVGGDLNVKVNAVEVFVSAPMSQPVKHVNVRFNGVDHGELYVNPSLVLPGNLIVRGARLTQSMSNQADIGGQLTYLASGSANDTVSIDELMHALKNVNITLGAGTNLLQLRGGLIAGNLTVNGGPGDDKVELLADGDLLVAKSLTFNLGGGANNMECMAAKDIEVGRNLNYVGGAARDAVSLTGASSLVVGGDSTWQLGNAPEMLANYLYLGETQVAGNLRVVGGARDDIVRTSKDLMVQKNMSVQLGGGTNVFRSDAFGATLNQIGGHLTYAGGAGSDHVIANGLFIDKNFSITLGDSPDDLQFIHLGHVDTVFTHGKLTVTGGARNDEISLRQMIVFKGLSVQAGGGADTVTLDNVDISESTLIDLGAGADSFSIELQSALAGNSMFNGKLTVLAGTGDDTVDFSDDGDATTASNFGGKVVLVGGAGADQFDNAGNNFFVLGNFEDFEVNDPLP